MGERLKTSETLERERERQVAKYIELGFHKELGLSEEEYRSSLPIFKPQSPAYKSRFDVPILVETRIAVGRLTELAVVTYYLGGLKFQDWEDDPKGYKTPNVPYVTWLQSGSRYVGKSVSDARSLMSADERGATVFDGIALYIQNPSVLRRNNLDLPGTSVGPNRACYLRLGVGELRLGAGPVDTVFPRFGSVTCGR